MALIDFKNTHNQSVYVNPAHVAYIAVFEEDVTIIALAVTGAGGKPVALYVRGDIDHIHHRLSTPPIRHAA